MSRPGTSKSPQPQHFGQKRRDSDPANPLNWTRVLNMLSRDNQLPVKKLCMMDEVEISPSRTLPTQLPSTNQFSPRASSSMEPVELFIRDDNEFSFDPSAKPNIWSSQISNDNKNEDSVDISVIKSFEGFEEVEEIDFGLEIVARWKMKPDD